MWSEWLKCKVSVFPEMNSWKPQDGGRIWGGDGSEKRMRLNLLLGRVQPTPNRCENLQCATRHSFLLHHPLISSRTMGETPLFVQRGCILWGGNAMSHGLVQTLQAIGSTGVSAAQSWKEALPKSIFLTWNVHVYLLRGTNGAAFLADTPLRKCESVLEKSFRINASSAFVWPASSFHRHLIPWHLYFGCF